MSQVNSVFDGRLKQYNQHSTEVTPGFFSISGGIEISYTYVSQGPCAVSKNGKKSENVHYCKHLQRPVNVEFDGDYSPGQRDHFDQQENPRQCRNTLPENFKLTCGS